MLTNKHCPHKVEIHFKNSLLLVAADDKAERVPANLPEQTNAHSTGNSRGYKKIRPMGRPDFCF